MTRLRFGLVAVAIWLPAEALAEICDKGAGGDAWMPEHGPVWLLNPVGWPIGILALTIGLLLAARGAKWIGYGVAAFLVSQITLRVFVDLLPQHDVYRMQVEEGCVSVITDWADIGLVTIFAIAYGWLGFRRHRAEVADVMRRV
jgi:hypothetical protein